MNQSNESVRQRAEAIREKAARAVRLGEQAKIIREQAYDTLKAAHVIATESLKLLTEANTEIERLASEVAGETPTQGAEQES